MAEIASKLVLLLSEVISIAGVILNLCIVVLLPRVPQPTSFLNILTLNLTLSNFYRIHPMGHNRSRTLTNIFELMNSVAIMSICVFALCHFVAIVNNFKLGRFGVLGPIIYMAMIWIGCFIYSFTHFGHYFLQPAKLRCGVESDGSARGRLIFMTILLLGLPAIICLSFMGILYVLERRKRVFSKIVSDTTELEQLDQGVTNMIHRAIIVSLGFSLLWFIRGLEFAIILITRSGVSVVFDTVGAMSSRLNAVVNPIAIFMIDQSLRKAASRLFE
ncbi:hypothetical protein EDD86DRAFT_261235 [Gorgonomyces haynaldii]|nr:hypothetical protein EDD86DRAFT_261235 [Gorgonomyces haynaldii]